jgi:hypothetical protein
MVDNAEGKGDDIQRDECDNGADSERRLESRWKREGPGETTLKNRVVSTSEKNSNV